MRRLTSGLIAAAALAACRNYETVRSDSVRVGPALPVGAHGSAPKLRETLSMKMPESVRYDLELDVYYVSNINGNPSQHDNNGSILIVSADSLGPATRILVEGGKNGVTLDAPKGLALVGDTLWAADITHVRAFNRHSGAVVADIDLSPQHATFLNDVAIGEGGSIYVTDTGISIDASGAVTHPGTDQIFKITGRSATSLKPESLNSPNGIAWDSTHHRFVLAPSAGTSVQTWKEGDASTAILASGPGQYDGIELLADGRILVSSWADSSVSVIRNGVFTPLVSGVSGPADIGVDTKRGILAVPRFNDGKVDYYKIP